MTRHQRRKAARARKNAKAAILNSRAIATLQRETLKRNLVKGLPRSSPKGMGNRGIYQAIGMYPAPGYGTGAFKEKPLGERQLRQMRADDKGKY